MALSFKNKKRRFRSFMSSVVPVSLLKSLGTVPGTKSLPPLNEQMTVKSWVRFVHMGIRPWDSESVKMWEELIGYQLVKAHHAKMKNHNEHEFIICEFISEKDGRLELRFDRAAGKRKDSDSTSSGPSSIETASTAPNSPPSSVAHSHIHSSDSSSHSSSPGSRVSKSMSSFKAQMSKSAASLRRFSHRPIPRSSDISLNEHLASDTVTRIQGRPSGAMVLKTVTFDNHSTQRPNLCDLLVLVDVLYNEHVMYRLVGGHCYWHADTILAMLEEWGKKHRTGTLLQNGEHKRRQGSIGSIAGVQVHHRDLDQVPKIWDDFMRGRRLMEEKRAEYEQLSKEEIRKKFSQEQEERERRIRMEQDEKERKLKRAQEERERRIRMEQDEKEQQLKRDQEERERRIRLEQDEKEQRLRKEQDEREQRLRKEFKKEQEEKERQMKKEQEEKERRIMKEQAEKERQMKKEQEEKERRMMKEKEEMKKEQEELKQQVKMLMRIIGDSAMNPPTTRIAPPDSPIR